MNTSIKKILRNLEEWAPSYLQESYDNTGLITGDVNAPCTGILCTLDATEPVIREAIEKKCNLVVAHHPIVFKPLRKFTPTSYVEKTLLLAIKNDIAIYAIHTSLDNVPHGVNGAIAAKIGLSSCEILSAKTDLLSKLYTYVPLDHADKVREAIFHAGAGHIGKYAECSFSTEGRGTFRPLPGSDPFIGKASGERESVEEIKLEFLLPSAIQQRVLEALFQSHPYEEVAYEIVRLANNDQYTGSGLIGELKEQVGETELLEKLKAEFKLRAIRHTRFLDRPVRKVAVCGGAGSFLLKEAMAKSADVFITSDIKYHEFFDAEDRILLADIGHYESEQYTIELLANFLQDKNPTFAVLKTETNTNPVQYFV
jgi:dinuclear metal center YbgI/SA1388 family protein